eukprot:g2530.t1
MKTERKIQSSRIEQSAMSRVRQILLFDIMDTVVYDPFYKQVPQFFDLSLQELFEVKHPDMWILFEKGEIEEKSLLDNFFLDRRSFDHNAFVNMMCENYTYLEGMRDLLKTLKSLGAEMHAFSNYPIWFKKIEDKLQISDYLDWTFVSCFGPMRGVRKPDQRAYEVTLETLNCKAADILLIDDRERNITAAKDAGMDTVVFKSCAVLIEELRKRGWSV